VPGRTTTRSIRIVAGEIDTRTVATRLVIPSAGQPVWPPFLRVAESIAARGRTLPPHAHEREEVLTYVTEGFAVYQLGRDPPDALSQGAARLLTTGARVEHRVSPAQGGAIRWFNLVVGLPSAETRAPRIQSAPANSPTVEIDTVRVRPLVGPRAPMSSAVGLECQELVFVNASTTIPRVGPRRRGILYALAGRGTVDDLPVEAGEAALVEGVPGIAVHGGVGFRAMLATAPTEPTPSIPGSEPR
jgi:redox-sensitive bicupin YhaK (pirin superfamily)